MKKAKYIENKGFTLIELLVVIAIIAILTGVVTASFGGVRARSRDAQRKSDLRSIQSALELYRSDQGFYPPSLPNCGSPLTKAYGNPNAQSGDSSVLYVSKIPCDPLATGTFTYKYTATASCNNTTTMCNNYLITDCLENTSDPDGTAVGSAVCSSKVQYQLTNP